MPDFFKRLSFKKKILSSYILFIIISCFLIGVYFLKSMENAKEESLSYMCQFSEQVSMSTDVIISNVDRIRFMHFIDDTIKYIIRRSMSDKTMAELIDENNYMERALNHMTNMNQYVLRATLINEYREVYSNVQTNNEAYLKKMEAIDSRQDWADKNKVWYTGVYEEEINLIPFELVTSISKVYDMNQEENIGTLYIDLNFSNIRQMLDRLVESRTSRTKLLIFEEQAFWNQMNSAEESAVRHFLETGISKDNELVIYGEKCLVSDIWNQTTGWQIFTWTPLSDIYVSGWNNIVTIISAMLLLLVAAVFLGIYLANQISRPVLILAEAMEQVDQGKVNLLEQKEQDWQDEMGMLFRSYNEMGKRINDSIEKIYIYQINQKQTELKMLQFQINPHFLYNTLNTISSIAALSDIDDIVKIADNLSGMFQYNIKGDDIVPVGKEIQHVKNYLEIQAIRFPGKYQFEYQIAPKIEQQKMLKFLLQPLAENSLQHAFVKMKKINKICITVEEQGEDILFRLCDNGVGMRAKQVEALNLELARTDTRTLVNHVDKGIGLRNVNARIKNLYGKEYGIQVRSEEGCYTEVRIKIRRIGEEDTF